MNGKLKQQIKVIYDCERKLEEDRNSHNYDLVRKNRILTEEELANHEIYLILKNLHK
jgi:hypothetical protein